MTIVIGVSLRVAGRVYDFETRGVEYRRDDRVVVETQRGQELGTVRVAPHEVENATLEGPLRLVLRHATAADLLRAEKLHEREALALTTARRMVSELTLPMRIADAEYTLDGGHVLLHFLSETRVDFRLLVRNLAHELHSRIELRQIGVRDEAKVIGGHGTCGCQLCCSSFLGGFTTVSINMAKTQGLALNPQKISGNCGRLMCCLAYEQQHYCELREGMPKINARVATPRGAGKVAKVNALSRQVEVLIPEAPGPIWFSIEELEAARDAVAEGRDPAEVVVSSPAAVTEIKRPVRRESARPVRSVRSTPPPAPPEATVEKAVGEGSANDATRKRRRRRGKRGGSTETAATTGTPPAGATPPATGGEASEGGTPGAGRKRRRRRGGRGGGAGGGEATPPAGE
jgi:cell fate regulator YaaT (PSP1 superfamily)